MKKIIFVIVLAITSCKAQQLPVTTTLPLGEFDYPNGAYLKDINNELLPFVGTWVGIFNNKRYTIKLRKFTQQLITADYINYEFIDDIAGDLKVEDITTNTVLYDNLNIVNYEDLNLISLGKPRGSMFKFMFRDTDANCNNYMEFYLQKQTNINQLKYRDFRFTEDRMKGDCIYDNREDAPRTLPNGEFILTKQ
jgi:hypothetical protein